MKLRHIRSQGEIRAKEYLKTSTLCLAMEAEELQRCARFNFTTQYVRPIKFISFDQEENLLCTEFVPGQSFFNKLWNVTTFVRMFPEDSIERSKLLLRIEDVGRWLASYHNSWYGSFGQKESALWVLESFRRKLNAVRTQGLMRKRLLMNLEGLLSHFKEEFEKDFTLTVSRIHGDFISHNMIFDQNGKVFIIDFADTRIGFSLEDVVRFWGNLWTMRQRNKISKEYFELACQVFLKGYGVNSSITNECTFTLLRMYNAINYILNIEAAKPYMNCFLYWSYRRAIRLEANEAYDRLSSFL